MIEEIAALLEKLAKLQIEHEKANQREFARIQANFDRLDRNVDRLERLIESNARAIQAWGEQRE